MNNLNNRLDIDILKRTSLEDDYGARTERKTLAINGHVLMWLDSKESHRWKNTDICKIAHECLKVVNSNKESFSNTEINTIWKNLEWMNRKIDSGNRNLDKKNAISKFFLKLFGKDRSMVDLNELKYHLESRHAEPTIAMRVNVEKESANAFVARLRKTNENLWRGLLAQKDADYIFLLFREPGIDIYRTDEKILANLDDNVKVEVQQRFAQLRKEQEQRPHEQRFSLALGASAFFHSFQVKSDAQLSKELSGITERDAGELLRAPNIKNRDGTFNELGERLWKNLSHKMHIFFMEDFLELHQQVESKSTTQPGHVPGSRPSISTGIATPEEMSKQFVSNFVGFQDHDDLDAIQARPDLLSAINRTLEGNPDWVVSRPALIDLQKALQRMDKCHENVKKSNPHLLANLFFITFKPHLFRDRDKMQLLNSLPLDIRADMLASSKELTSLYYGSRSFLQDQGLDFSAGGVPPSLSENQQKIFSHLIESGHPETWQELQENDLFQSTVKTHLQDHPQPVISQLLEVLDHIPKGSRLPKHFLGNLFLIKNTPIPDHKIMTFLLSLSSDIRTNILADDKRLTQLYYGSKSFLQDQKLDVSARSVPLSLSVNQQKIFSHLIDENHEGTLAELRDDPAFRACAMAIDTPNDSPPHLVHLKRALQAFENSPHQFKRSKENLLNILFFLEKERLFLAQPNIRSIIESHSRMWISQTFRSVGREVVKIRFGKDTLAYDLGTHTLLRAQTLLTSGGAIVRGGFKEKVKLSNNFEEGTTEIVTIQRTELDLGDKEVAITNLLQNPGHPNIAHFIHRPGLLGTCRYYKKFDPRIGPVFDSRGNEVGRQEVLRTVAPFYSKGSLDKCADEFNLVKKRQAAIDVINGLLYMHGKKIVHCDLKDENLFAVEEPGGMIRVIIADFGLASDQPVGDRGTPAYVPPEVWQGKNWSTQGDAWSFGFVLSKLFFNRFPFDYSDTSSPQEIQTSVTKLIDLQKKEPNDKNSPEYAAWKKLTTTPDQNSLEYVIWSLTRVDPKERMPLQTALKWFEDHKNFT